MKMSIKIYFKIRKFHSKHRTFFYSCSQMVDIGICNHLVRLFLLKGLALPGRIIEI